MELELIPLKLAEANEYVAMFHRHHKPVVGHRFSIGLLKDGEPCGAIIIGRPVARMIEHRTTAEVTRCVTDGTPNACSKLYAAAWRAWRAMGGKRLITYTLESEPGTSLTAAGWTLAYKTKNAGEKGWDVPSRPRERGTYLGPKNLWEIAS